MQSITTLLLLASIPAIQSITCNEGCYTINLESVNLDQGNNAQCYTYSVSLSSTAECNVGSQPKILFGIDTNTCYINTNDLASKITSTTPTDHTIKEDDSNDQIIGIEFDIDTTNPLPNVFTICIQGIPAGSETTTGPIQISDSLEQCTFGADITPNFCGICDGEEAETSCFCSNTVNECVTSGRPRGALSCQWDGNNNRCIAEEAPECTQPAAERPCVCFEVKEFCDAVSQEGSRGDCGWDEQRELCSPTDCIDEFGCDCFQIEQDCESTPIIDFPQDCIWTIDEECIEFDGTTEFPVSTDIDDTETTQCVEDCGCWDNEIDCEDDHSHLEIPLRCIWVDECIEETMRPTKAPYYMETSTEMPSVDTTHVWQKPSKSWGKGNNGGNGGNGGKGSKGGKGGKSGKGGKGSNP